MKKRKYLLPSFISLQLLLESLVPAPLSASGVHQESKTSEQVSISVESANKKRPTNLWASAKIRQASNGLFMGHRSHSSHSSHRSHSSHSSSNHSSHSSHYSHSSGGGSVYVPYTPATTTPTTTTTTIPPPPPKMLQVQGKKGKVVKLETCWFAELPIQPYIGLPVRLEVKQGQGEWFTPVHIEAKLRDVSTLIKTICPRDPGALSAVTSWVPLKKGKYQLRHVLTFEGSAVYSDVHQANIS